MYNAISLELDRSSCVSTNIDEEEPKLCICPFSNRFCRSQSKNEDRYKDSEIKTVIEINR